MFDREAWLGSPFELDLPHRFEEEVTRLAENTVSLREDDLLSIGHASACLGKDVFELLSPRQRRNLARPIADYRRLFLACGRAYASISALRGRSQAMKSLRSAVWSACFGRSLNHALELWPVIREHDVLVFGETGTGKDLVAKAIVAGTVALKDPPPSGTLNAAALPQSLIESELFGHVRGAFTGATETRSGRIRHADGGTFFLDEVGDLPKTTQVKLLRVIENDELYPLGADHGVVVDVRYVAATHKDLPELVRRGEFRRDLYERLAGQVISVPALRDRPQDVEVIGIDFLDNIPGLPPPLREQVGNWLTTKHVRKHAWPGNVRELQNALRSKLLGLSPELGGKPADAPSVPEGLADGTASLQEAEMWYMQHVLSASHGNYSKAARTLGIDRSTLRRKLDRA